MNKGFIDKHSFAGIASQEEMKSELEKSQSYDGKHTIVYNDSSHRYKLDGEATSGVTTILKGSLPTSYGIIKWGKIQVLEYLD